MISDLDLARLCAQTYVPPWISVPHSHGVVHFQIHEIDGQTILAIQGTQSRKQLIADLCTLPRRSKAGWWAHGGFLAAAEALAPMVERHMPKLDIVTGHSLGGAVSVALAGLLVAKRSPSSFRVVAFGCPRVGMAGLRTAVKDVEITSYKNAPDVVTTVPWPVPLPFRHARQAIRVGGGRLNPIAAHEIDNYIEALGGDAERAAAE